MVHDNFRQLIAQSRDGKIHALRIAIEDSPLLIKPLTICEYYRMRVDRYKFTYSERK